MMVIVDTCGRFGNRIWTYANLLAFGYENKVLIANPGFREFSSYFEDSGRKRAASEIAGAVNSLPLWVWRLAYRCNLRLRAVSSKRLDYGEMVDLDDPLNAEAAGSQSLAFVSGMYYIATQCLRRHSEDVRRFFQPNSGTQQAAETLVACVRKRADVLVGVHIRHGDYKTYCEGMMYYSAAEYAATMQQIRDLWPGMKVGFMVCSDEPQVASDFRELDVAFGPGTVMGDICALSLCDYLVGPPSTFSRWASFAGSTPFWTLDWKAAAHYGAASVCKAPSVSDFSVCYSPSHLVDEDRLARVPY